MEIEPLHEDKLCPRVGRPIRILHVVNSFAFQNAAQLKIVMTVLDGLDPEQFRCDVIATHPGDDLIEELRSRSPCCKFLNWQRGIEQPGNAIALLSHLHSNRIDIVHQHILSRSLPWIARLAGCKTILHLHGGIDEGTGRELFFKSSRKFDAILATSNWVSQRAQAPIVRTVYPSVQLDEIDRDYQPCEEFIFGVAARLESVKNISLLIRAFAKLVKADSSVRLEIAGDGAELAALVELTRALRVEEYVRFLGWRTDMRKVLPNWHCFVLPSLSEGFGLAALEAMAAGLPVIASCVGGLRELITHRSNGLHVAPNDVDGLTSAMEELRTHPELCEALGKAARRRAADFSPQRQLEIIEEVYRALACGR
ncbi:MAG TPA: glycosyltransferase family 4 protein [Terracidiphilus sp.]|jgi:glycosyltransferase involved in cell wall biosynthesis|nr:glycosyltransferase family 4 protein [Terracidiphilus sp.]